MTNLNYSWRPEELESLRRVDRRMLKLMVWTMHEQSKHGRFFLFENPPKSHIWGEPDMQSVYQLPGVQQGIGDACMYGKIIPKHLGEGAGLHLYKQHRWLSNSEQLLQATCARCTGSHEHFRSKYGSHIEGKLTKWSGEYTPALVKSILTAITSLPRLKP